MNDQLKLWQSQWGDDYQARNAVTEEVIQQREMFWHTVFGGLNGQQVPQTILEVGAGNGANIQAMKNMFDKFNYEVTFDAVEPNQIAAINLAEQNIVNTIFPSLENVTKKYDLVFTSGVLIHIHPDKLLEFTKNIYKLSNRFIICAEYFRPEPETKPYHGENQALFMRDFGGFYLDNFPLSCLTYGFAWKRLQGVDNLTFWTFKKAN